MVKCRDEVTSSRPKENPLEHLLQGVYLYSLFSMGCITPLVVPPPLPWTFTAMSARR